MINVLQDLEEVVTIGKLGKNNKNTYDLCEVTNDP